MTAARMLEAVLVSKSVEFCTATCWLKISSCCRASSAVRFAAIFCSVSALVCVVKTELMVSRLALCLASISF